MKLRSATFRSVALGVLLAFAAARLVVPASAAGSDEGDGASPEGKSTSAADNGSAGVGGASPGVSGAGGPARNATILPPFPIGSAGSRWLSNSAAKLTAPLGNFLRRTQRASTHAATDIVHGGESTLNWLTNHVRTLPDDQDKALEAVRTGEIVPLASVLKTVQKSVPGDVLNVKLTHDTIGAWNYTITVLTPQGYYRDVDVDAGKNNVTSIRPH